MMPFIERLGRARFRLVPLGLGDIVITIRESGLLVDIQDTDGKYVSRTDYSNSPDEETIIENLMISIGRHEQKRDSS